MARSRAHLGSAGLFPVCRALLDALSLRDARVGDGWQCERARLCSADDPRDLEGACAARGVARAARAAGTFFRGAAQRLSETERGMPPRGEPGRVAGRRRVRWDLAAGDAQRGGLGLGVAHSPEPRGDVGRRALSPRYLGGVSQARPPHRVTGGADDP